MQRGRATGRRFLVPVARKAEGDAGSGTQEGRDRPNLKLLRPRSWSLKQEAPCDSWEQFTQRFSPLIFY